MFGIRELNVAIELWGAVFCIFGIACVLLITRADARYRNLLVAGFVAELAAAGGDAVAGMFRGVEGSLAWSMVHLGNYVTFLGNFLLVAVLTVYLCKRIHASGGAENRTWYVVACIATGVMCALTLFGSFFTIDAANVYHRSGGYWLAPAFAALVNGVNAVIVVANRKKLSGTAFACLLFYAAAPLVASIAQMTVYGLNFVIVAGVLALMVVLFELQEHTARALQERTEALASSKMEVSESRIAVMVSQIQPHFLFNTLDTIYGLVDEDTELAKQALASFSRYLRTNLDSLKHMKPVPIEREMEHVRTYLELERMSDESRLEYELDVQATGFSVPALSVQTIVENAVKHGLGGRERGGKVIVRTREQATEYTVAVIDDGAGFDLRNLREDGPGVGLANTRSRLAAMCSGTLDVISEPGAGTTVVMHVPKSADERF